MPEIEAQNAEYASILPRDLRVGMVARFYVSHHATWGQEADCEVVQIKKVTRGGYPKYAVTIVEPAYGLRPEQQSTRYLSPQSRLTVRARNDSSGAV